MSTWITVEEYRRGSGEEPVETLLNLDNVVSFFGATLNDGRPVVYMDTSRICGIMLRGTLEEICDKIVEAQTK